MFIRTLTLWYISLTEVVRWNRVPVQHQFISSWSCVFAITTSSRCASTLTVHHYKSSLSYTSILCQCQSVLTMTGRCRRRLLVTASAAADRLGCTCLLSTCPWFCTPVRYRTCLLSHVALCALISILELISACALCKCHTREVHHGRSVAGSRARRYSSV